jgi:hypothetical protein
VFYFSARNRKDVNRRIAAYCNWQWWIYMLFRAHTHLFATRQGTTYKHHMPGRFCTFPGHPSLYSYPLRRYLCLMLESAFIARLGNSCSIHFRYLVIRDMHGVRATQRLRAVKCLLDSNQDYCLSSSLVITQPAQVIKKEMPSAIRLSCVSLGISMLWSRLFLTDLACLE